MPIGNLDDISVRALKILQEVELVAAEDTRSAQKMLRCYGLHKPLISLYRDNEAKRLPSLLQAFADGKRIALISEAGTPCISDPGYLTVKAVLDAGYPVIPIPGASAITSALCASGMPSHHFAFLGFLPQRTGKRRNILNAYKDLPATLILYAAPHRVETLIQEIIEILGDRHACIARELTKFHEEILRGSLSSLRQTLLARETPKGEFVLLIEGSPEYQPIDLDQYPIGDNSTYNANYHPDTDTPTTACQPDTANSPEDCHLPLSPDTECDTSITPTLSLKEQIQKQALHLLAQGGRITQIAQQLARQFPSLSRRQAYRLLLNLSDNMM
jgi:16S rRNA (cytidine1402-2'-O)-methyltransferase